MVQALYYMEDKEIIKLIISNYLKVSEKSLLEFITKVEVETVPKGTTFIRKNKPNKFEYFILKGICRSMVQNEEGDLITISFFQNQSVITPHVIRTSDETSNLSFETLTDTIVGMVDAEEFLQLMIENIEIRTFANMVLQEELVQKVNKEINMASVNAKGRLTAFRGNHKNLENLIPHEMIASYLGITTISLSRLRKELSLDS